MRATVDDLCENFGRYIKNCQHEPVVVTQRGRPAALLVGVAGRDWETIQRETDPAFWQMLDERRAQAAAPFPQFPTAGNTSNRYRSPETHDIRETSAGLSKRLGDLLRRARERQGMSLKAVSERVGSETYYGMIERGQRRPSHETLKRLHEVLDMTPEERDESIRLVDESTLAGKREQARARAQRAGLVAEDPASYGQAARSRQDGQGGDNRLDRLEQSIRRIHHLLAGSGRIPGKSRRRRD
jgi:prevent-host-death family protein